jgi:hypothetical protein
MQLRIVVFEFALELVEPLRKILVRGKNARSLTNTRT